MPSILWRRRLPTTASTTRRRCHDGVDGTSTRRRFSKSYYHRHPIFFFLLSCPTVSIAFANRFWYHRWTCNLRPLGWKDCQCHGTRTILQVNAKGEGAAFSPTSYSPRGVPFVASSKEHHESRLLHGGPVRLPKQYLLELPDSTRRKVKETTKHCNHIRHLLKNQLIVN